MKLDASDIADLKPLIATAVRSTLEEIQAREAELGGALAYSEPQAAALLNVLPHVLGDARRRGEITAKRIGKRWMYSRACLIRYLET